MSVPLAQPDSEKGVELPVAKYAASKRRCTPGPNGMLVYNADGSTTESFPGDAGPCVRHTSPNNTVRVTVRTRRGEHTEEPPQNVD